MQSMFYGKVGRGMAIAGLILVGITMVLSFIFGWIIPENIVFSFYICCFILIITAIIIAIVGIFYDESKLIAIEALIFGIISLVIVSFLTFVYIFYG